MLPVDKDSNMVYFSEWIKNFTCYESIIEKLNRNQIKFDLLPFTNDYWVRDFMPIQISETEFIEYKYNPDYLQNKPTYITNPEKCCRHLNISTKKIDVVLDGGNIIKCTDAIILTDKVFVENRNQTRTQLIDTLANAFQCNIVVIPWDRNEKYGHADVTEIVKQGGALNCISWNIKI